MYKESSIVKDWRNIDLSFGLIYPNHYKLGMSSYSIRLLYHIINSNENYACERIFLPENIKFPASKDFSSINHLRSIENKILPKDFDILGFSAHYENDFKNILWILDKAEIPLESKKRHGEFSRDSDDYPLIIGGGPAITSNPLPLSHIFDLFFIGDAEPNLNDFLCVYLEQKTQNNNFKTFLDKAKNIEGLYIPILNNKTKRVFLKDLNKSPTPTYQLLSKSESDRKIFEENYFVEVNRGCPFQCKFCLSSFHNYPFRNKSYNEIINAIEVGLEYSEFEKISLIGSCVSSHPKFYEICEFILDAGKTFSIPSIRVEHITPKIIHLLERSGVKTITIAPETGTESLRFDLGKKITNDKILEVLSLIKESKIKNIKFYFLIGLPHETDEDIKEIIKLFHLIEKLGFKENELRVNVNSFIPKLNTPYENQSYFYLTENINNYRLKYTTLIHELNTISSIKIKFKNPKKIINDAKLQTLFSLGDQNIAKILLAYYLNGANMGALRRVEKEFNFSINDYFKKIQDGYVPWKF
ncbi:MAG: radical SAM protein [Candidatus Lokiarchaeota archaeon]|nr:radical SAM protein [Candidatus Lokiarchaeota archaeon]